MASNKQWVLGILFAAIMAVKGLLSAGVAGVLGGVAGAFLVAYVVVAAYNRTWGGDEEVLTVEDVQG